VVGLERKVRGVSGWGPLPLASRRSLPVPGREKTWSVSPQSQRCSGRKILSGAGAVAPAGRRIEGRESCAGPGSCWRWKASFEPFSPAPPLSALAA
jgi:hypothetical protein